MACTVSEAQWEYYLELPDGFRVKRRRSLYITWYIILRHSERWGFQSTFLDAGDVLVVVIFKSFASFALGICTNTWIYTDLITER